MPKGDRLKLKADPEDGTTPIANLLLEAVAMARISGLQKGAIVYLWRCTYGWIGDDGKRKKEAKITLGDWVKALDKDKSRISKALGELCEMNIISRRIADVWGGYYYSLNTNINKWNSHSINLSKLKEAVTMAHLPTVGDNTTVGNTTNSPHKSQQLAKVPTVGDNKDSTVGENDNSTVGENDNKLPIYKEILNKDINKECHDLKNHDDKEVNESLKIEENYKKQNPKWIKYRSKIFGELKKRREYNLTKGKTAGEAKSMNWMFGQGYLPEDILKVYDIMKQDKFWKSKPLTLMTVANNIGEVLKNGDKQQPIKHQSTVKIIG